MTIYTNLVTVTQRLWPYARMLQLSWLRKGFLCASGFLLRYKLVLSTVPEAELAVPDKNFGVGLACREAFSGRRMLFQGPTIVMSRHFESTQPVEDRDEGQGKRQIGEHEHEALYNVTSGIIMLHVQLHFMTPMTVF